MPGNDLSAIDYYTARTEVFVGRNEEGLPEHGQGNASHGQTSLTRTRAGDQVEQTKPHRTRSTGTGKNQKNSFIFISADAITDDILLHVP